MNIVPYSEKRKSSVYQNQSERSADVAVSYDKAADSMTILLTLHNDIAEGSFDI